MIMPSDAFVTSPVAQTPTGSVSVQVSALINRARKGDEFDIEHTGHAYDVLEELQLSLARQPALYEDVASKIESFARKSGTSNLYAHLLVTNNQPDLGQYDPSQVFIYDGVQDSGTEFSSVQMRSTIFGTVMTSVNVTDLADYFRSGNKYQLVMHLGSNRDQDAIALENLIAMLPEMLAASGMSPAEIAEVITAIKSGNIAPAALKALHVAAQIVTLKSQPPTPQILAKIQALSAQYAKIMASPKALNGISLVLVNALTRMQTPIRALAANPSMPIRAVVRAQNNNRPGITEIRTLITAIRTQRTALKQVPVAERRAIAQALRDLRAGMRTTPGRLQLGITAINKTLSVLMAKPAASALISKVLPAALAATARFSTPVLMNAFRVTLAPLIMNPQTLPAPIRTSLRAALAAPAIAQGTRQLAAMLTAHPVIAQSIPPAPLAQNILSAPVSALVEPKVTVIAPSAPTSIVPPAQTSDAPKAEAPPAIPPTQSKPEAKTAQPLDCCKPVNVTTTSTGDVVISDDKGKPIIKMDKQEYEAVKAAETQAITAIRERNDREGNTRTAEQKQAETNDIAGFAAAVMDGTHKPSGGHEHTGDCCKGFEKAATSEPSSNAAALSASANKGDNKNETPPPAAPLAPAPKF